MNPEDRKSFIEFCLRKLGKGAVNVNITVDQIDDAVDVALNLFWEQHMEGSEEVWLIHTITADDVNQKYIQLADDFVAVSNVMRPNIQAGIYSIEYQFFLNELYTMSGLYRYGDISYYIMNKMHLDLMNRYFLPDKSWTYNKTTNKLIVAGGLKNTYYLDGSLIITAHRKVLGEAGDTEDPSNTSYYNIWKNRWLQNYTIALLKKQWATNLTKFQGVQLPGGITMNYNDLKAEAESELEKLDLQLKTEYSWPIDFIMA